MDREVILTEEGHAKLKDEIEYLSGTKRREVAERSKEAREFGDISENSEYDDAKNEQAQVEYRIQQLEQKLRNARVVDTDHLPKDTVSIGALVTLKDINTKKTPSSVRPRPTRRSSVSPTRARSGAHSWGARRARRSRSPCRGARSNTRS